MLQIKQYLIMLLPFYIMAYEQPIDENQFLSEDEVIKYLQGDSKLPITSTALDPFLGSLQPVHEKLPHAKDSSLTDCSSLAVQPTINPTPLSSLTTSEERPPLLKSDGTPYKRGPYNTKFKKLLYRAESFTQADPVIPQHTAAQKQKPSSHGRKKTASKGKNTKHNMKYTKRNIHIGISSNDPRYHKLYAAAYAQALLKDKA